MSPLLGQYMHAHVRGSPFQCVMKLSMLPRRRRDSEHNRAFCQTASTIEDIASNFFALFTC